MKKAILLSLMALNISVYAQLNNSFYLCTGSWTANSNVSIKLAKDLGAKGAGNSVKIVWRNIQDSLITIPSLWTWTSIDATIQALQNDTLDIYANVLCVGPKKTSPNSCNLSYNPSGPNGGQSWFPEDTVQWKQFIYAMIDRYDKNGTNDMPGLKFPVNKWRIETEWQSFWCSSNPDTSLLVAKEFTKFVNMTANVIKTKQPAFTVSYAGMDIIHDKVVFYDGYTGESSYCLSNCVSSGTQTQVQMSIDADFLAKRRNMIYILRNCNVDEIDIHQYGRWKYIPNTIQWYKDSAYTGTKPINFLEGAGPYCKMCDSIYHPGTDTTGVLPSQLVRDNSSYLVYWHIMGLANKVNYLSWYRLTPDYNNSGTSFGDFCLLSKNYVKKPAYYTYRFLAKNIFLNPNADSVVKITESNPNLYHYEIQPMAMNVVWSTNSTDSIIISGTGNLYTWDIPITCNTIFPTVCDSVFPMNNYSVTTSHTILLNNSVPVFYSWNNLLGINTSTLAESISVKIYPNPFSNFTTLEIIPQEGKMITNLPVGWAGYDLKIYDLYGRKIKEYKITKLKTEISRDDLKNGMYFYQVKDEKQNISSGKLIVQ